MEDIVKKLDQKKPVHVRQAFNKLIALMLDKKKKGVKLTRQSEEIVFLKEQCISPCLSISRGGLDTLCNVVLLELLSKHDVTTVLLSLSVKGKNLYPLLQAILSLQELPLQSSPPNMADHPFVLVLQQCGDQVWQPMLDLIRLTTSQTPELFAYFTPVFSYILCTRDPTLTLAAKQNTWQLLTRLTMDRPRDRIRVLLHHFVWFQSSSLGQGQENTENILFLDNLSSSTVDQFPSHAILYLVTYSELLVRSLQGNSPHIELIWDTIESLTNEVIMESSNQHCATEVVQATEKELVPMILLLLVQCIPLCDENNLQHVLTISAALIDEFHVSHHRVVRLSPALLCSFISPLLPWLYTLGSSEQLKAVVIQFIQMIIDASLDETPKECQIDSESNQSLDSAESGSINLSYEEWEEHRHLLSVDSERIMSAQCLIRKLNEHNMDLWQTELAPFPGLDCLVAGHLTAKCLRPNHNMFDTYTGSTHDKQWRFLIAQTPSNALYLILWLLTRERQPPAIHHWLDLLVQTARDKDNIPLILNTLESLKLTRDPSVTSRLIILYTSLWSIEPRTFQFLLPLLDRNTSQMKAWIFDVVRASAMRTVCQKHPDIYGKELVPLLSSILSNYADSSSHTLPVTLCLESIHVLCQAGVVDFASVWTTLSVLRHDTRPRVMIGLISLMECGAPSSDSPHDTDHTELSYEISSVLWSYVASNISVDVTAAAFRTLSRFNFINDYPLKYLHEKFRLGIKIPKSVLGKLHQDSKAPEEHLMYIPGECFVRLLPLADFASRSASSLFPQPQPLRANTRSTQDQHGVNQSRIQLDQSRLEGSKEQVPAAYASFVQLMTSCVEKELQTYREIIYNSPYSDQAHTREPIDYSYLPYKSIVRALIKYVQTKIEDGLLYETTVITALDILASSYSKPLPPLNWSFLINAYLAPSKTNPTPSKKIIDDPHAAHQCKQLALRIAAQNCVTSQDTCRSLATYLTQCQPQTSEACILSQHLTNLCQHLNPTVFQDYFDSIGSNELNQGSNDLNQGSNELNLLDVEFVLYSYYTGIKHCLTQLGPKLSTLHLPPSTNLESNIFYLSSTVCQLYDKYSTRYLDTSFNIETPRSQIDDDKLFSVILDCIPHIPPVIRQHLLDNQPTPLTLLHIHLIRNKLSPLSLTPLIQDMSDANRARLVWEQFPSMLTQYSPNEVIQFLCEEVLTQRNKSQISPETVWKLFLLSLFSVSLHRHLLSFTLESECHRLHDFTLPSSQTRPLSTDEFQGKCSEPSRQVNCGDKTTDPSRELSSHGKCSDHSRLLNRDTTTELSQEQKKSQDKSIEISTKSGEVSHRTETERVSDPSQVLSSMVQLMPVAFASLLGKEQTNQVISCVVSAIQPQAGPQLDPIVKQMLQSMLLCLKSKMSHAVLLNLPLSIS
uniref:Focadhesin n=1 Tax=Cacopsylla melanoneura TaxID=428564 RepID=A0A8D8SIJ6_9HEMI